MSHWDVKHSIQNTVIAMDSARWEIMGGNTF